MLIPTPSPTAVPQTAFGDPDVAFTFVVFALIAVVVIGVSVWRKSGGNRGGGWQ